LAQAGLRHDLALAGLLLEWRSMFTNTAVQGARR
jgi:DNA polymerase III subunit delta'